MTMKTKITGLAALSLALLLACGEDKTVADHSYAGLRKVSLNDHQVFQGDITKIPGWDKMILPNGKAPVIAAKATPLALIPFRQARVMVLWHDYFRTQTYNMCTEFQNVAEVFGGRQLNKWSELLAGCQMMPGREVVYEGVLTKSGANVVGDIFVKPGINVVNIAFIDAGDTITHLSTAHYINFEGLGLELPAWYTDGWALSGSEIWESREHYKYSNGSYGDYYIVMGTNEATADIGFNKSFADYMCTYIP
jgi:hypothetical protein